MSISVGLRLNVSGLRPGEETARVVKALTAFLAKHDLEREVKVTEDASAGHVFAGSTYPIIVSGFGRWADGVEQGFHDTVRAVAPAAQVDFRWAFDNEDH